MSSEELARLCGRRYLSDEDLSWVKKNSVQCSLMFYVIIMIIFKIEK